MVMVTRLVSSASRKGQHQSYRASLTDFHGIVLVVILFSRIL